MDTTATSQDTAVETNASESAELDSLLGGGGEETQGSAAVETEEPAETEVDAEADSTATSDEPADEADASTEEAAEEEPEELSLEESDRDYSEAAYKKAAEFYSKKLKVQFDANDPKDRVTLSRLLQDRDALAAQRAEIEAAKVAESDEETASATEPAQPSQAERTERIKNAITSLQTFSKTRVVPEVAKHLSDRLGKALWGDEFKEFSQEQANGISEVFTEMLYHGLNDALPFLLDKTFGALGQDPIMTRMTSMAVREGAFEHLDSLKDAAGKALYPDLERMVDRGDIQRALKANPWIAESDFKEKDPIKREAKRIEAAYKISRGESIDPETVGKAVQTGKKQAEAAAKAKAAARVAPGKTKGPLGTQPTEGDQLVSNITSGAGYGSRFSKMLKDGAVRK